MSRRRLQDDGRAPARSDAGEPQAIQTAADVRSLLAEQIMQLTTNPDLDPLRKTPQITQLARVILRAIELETLEARLEAVEATLRLRQDNQELKER